MMSTRSQVARHVELDVNLPPRRFTLSATAKSPESRARRAGIPPRTSGATRFLRCAWGAEWSARRPSPRLNALDSQATRTAGRNIWPRSNGSPPLRPVRVSRDDRSRSRRRCCISRRPRLSGKVSPSASITGSRTVVTIPRRLAFHAGAATVAAFERVVSRRPESSIPPGSVRDGAPLLHRSLPGGVRRHHIARRALRRSARRNPRPHRVLSGVGWTAFRHGTVGTAIVVDVVDRDDE